MIRLVGWLADGRVCQRDDAYGDKRDYESGRNHRGGAGFVFVAFVSFFPILHARLKRRFRLVFTNQWMDH